MPLLTAQKHQWTKQPPYNFYHFPEEHKANWKTFWEEMGGDIDKILEFAKKADIEAPNEWFESLHRFLFSEFSGDAKLTKSAASKTFGAFLTEIAKRHQEDPKERNWYSLRGVTKHGFIAALERAAEINDLRQSVAYINARIKDFGFYLYSEYTLTKTKQKEKIKSVASDLNKEAYDLETDVLGESPLRWIAEGNVVTHAFFPGEKFMVIDVVADKDLDMLVTRDSAGKVAFIKDLWNVQPA